MSRNTKIKDVKIILSGLDNIEEEKKYFAKVETENCIPKNRDAIYLYADEPCVEACQLLYDLNIQTYTSNGHIQSSNEINPNAYVGIVYDTLSEENKKIAQEMIENGLIKDIYKDAGRGTRLTISLSVPIKNESLVGDVSDKLVELASMFKQQDVLYGKTTFKELMSSLFVKVDNNKYHNLMTHEIVSKEEMQQTLPDWIEYILENKYTADGITYFYSEDLLNKHLSYVENFETHKKR